MGAPTAPQDPAAAVPSWAFEAIGTRWQVDAAVPLTPAARRAVALRVDAFDRDWSRFRAGSVVDALRAGPGRHRLPDDADPLVRLYDALHAATDGAMSPAVGDGLEHLGYDASYSLRPRPGHRGAVDWGHVRWEPPYLVTTEPFVLDVGAAGKGYLADLVADEVEAVQRAEGATGTVTVDASGDLVHRVAPGGASLRVALEHPLRPGYAVGVADLPGTPGARALCASATNRRTWADGVHHVLDARTGVPVTDVLATWVVADSALVADGLATALFLVPPDAATVLAADLGATFVRLDRTPTGTRVHRSPDFPGEVFA
ncbi:FAD:protein FMN transferase [Nocardioides sp. ChNu-99]|uniref:FAD:protein FMN transferase n=1 Tax=Nocardioides sp. ChNu-99 TaxID=2839897 RepID=UPI002406DEA7|nr:FAD:protein FMN transferase [Nocardioides sp. ChNu-99]MDF9717145.1 FAD:protein FMN transferase [Nocardioides sp. ChNu-99]